MPYFSPVKPEQLAVIDCDLEIFFMQVAIISQLPTTTAPTINTNDNLIQEIKAIFENPL
jgi:hypothetical protein